MASRNFLSIVTRTQGRRPHTLPDMFSSLARQSDTDFEILLMGHQLDEAGHATVRKVLDGLPAWLREKTELIEVADGNRTRPLNVGFGAATGHYIAILDDDDVALPQWVSVFRSLSEAAPGKILRAATLRQKVRTVIVDDQPVLQLDGPAEAVFPKHFDFFEHLMVNRTPPLCLAFPRLALRALNLRFDESLTTTEDWDFLMRCAGLLGVAGTEDVTSIYRWWSEGQSSRTDHSESEWQANHLRIQAKWDSASFALPPGAVKHLLGTLSAYEDLREENRRLQSGLLELLHGEPPVFVPWKILPPEAVPDIESLRSQAKAILRSPSWRLTAPLRGIACLLGHRRALRLGDVEALPAETLARVIIALQNSFSLRIAAPMRCLKNRSGRAFSQT